MVNIKESFKDLKHGDIIDHQQFRSLIPKDVYDLCVEVSREGFSLTLVGGAVRDLLVTGNLSHDLDFELRHTFEYDEKDWSFRVNRLGERLREVYLYQVEFLSFSILRISFPGANYEVELGPARLEVYQSQGSYGHSDFKETLVSCAPYKETFKRRDFTLNALGVEFGAVQTEEEFRFIDPFGGLADLREKWLRPCSSDFSKDPVRFCRAVRFAVKMELELHPELEQMLKDFHLEKLTGFYFFREAFKSDFFKFTKLFFSLVDKHQVELSPDLERLRFLAALKGENLQLATERDVLLFLVYHEDFKEDLEKIEAFCEVSKSKMATYKAHTQFKETLRALDHFEGQSFLKSCVSLSFEEFLTKKELPVLKSFHQFVSRVGREPLAILGRLNSHLYANFLKVYEVLPTALLGKENFEESLKTLEVAPEKRGDLQYYCHFMEKVKAL